MNRLAICVCLCGYLLGAELAFSQSNWEQTGGPVGGDVTALVIDNAGQIFAGTRLGGIFRSLDGGESWSLLDIDLLFIGVYDLATNSDGHVFAGTSRHIYRSTDGGDSWTTQLLPQPFVETLTINADDILFAGTRGGVFRSDDNGETWSEMSTGLANTSVQALVVSPGGSLFAGTQGGVFFSNDNGQNWIDRNTGIENQNVVEVFVASEDTIFAGTFDGLFRSVNAGGDWSKVIPFDLVRAIARNAAGTLLGGSNRTFYRSSDGGAVWTQHDLGDLGSALFDELILDAEDHLIAGTFREGVIRSSDSGSTWLPSNTNLIASDIVSLALNSRGDLLAATGSGVFRTSDKGVTWTKASDGLPSENVEAISVDADDNIYAVLNSNGLFRSVDDGASWQPAGASLASQTVTCVAVAPNGDVYAGEREGGVYRSVNDGASWTLLDAGIPSTDVQTIGIAAAGAVFVGTRSNGVFRSTDFGATWDEINTGLPTSFDVTDFHFSSDASILVAVFDGVFRSQDNGDTWMATGNVPTRGVKAIARDSTENLYIASRGGGVAISVDDAQSWTSINAGLLHLDVTSVVVDAENNVFAGTRGGSVFKLMPTTTANSFDRTSLPQGFSLHQNYPNPFNPSTAINYQLPHRTSVELDVLNMLGQSVNVLLSGEQDAGVHSVLWDGTDRDGSSVSSGVYLYRLRTTEFVQTRRMLLVK